MVQEGIVLSNGVSKKGIEVNKVKIEVIDKPLPPTSVKGIRSLLEHAEFFRKFTKNFSKIAKHLGKLLEHDRPFNFNKNCLGTLLS